MRPSPSHRKKAPFLLGIVVSALVCTRLLEYPIRLYCLITATIAQTQTHSHKKTVTAQECQSANLCYMLKCYCAPLLSLNSEMHDSFDVSTPPPPTTPMLSHLSFWHNWEVPHSTGRGAYKQLVLSACCSQMLHDTPTPHPRFMLAIPDKVGVCVETSRYHISEYTPYINSWAKPWNNCTLSSTVPTTCTRIIHDVQRNE